MWRNQYVEIPCYEVIKKRITDHLNLLNIGMLIDVTRPNSNTTARYIEYISNDKLSFSTKCT